MAIEMVEKAEGEEALLVADEFIDWWQNSDDADFWEDWPDDEGEDEYDEEPEPLYLLGNWGF